MTDTTEITTGETPSAFALIQATIEQGADPAYLRELLAVRREWEADEARKAYFTAISQFQQRAPIIEKGDDAHGKSYARIDRIWRTIRPLVAELGLAVTWQKCEIADDGICHIEGRLSHTLGHSETIVADTALPELIRGQNKAQQVGSAETYAKRRALCSALGIVTGDDDDAHGAGKGASPIDADTIAQLDELLKSIGDLEDGGYARGAEWIKQTCGAESLQEIPESAVGKILTKLNAKLNKLKG